MTETTIDQNLIYDTFLQKDGAWRRWKACFRLIKYIPCILSLHKRAVGNKKSLFCIFADMWALIWRHFGVNVVQESPQLFIDEYYTGRLHLKSHPIDEYILEREGVTIFWMSSVLQWGKIRQLDHKLTGWKWLSDKGIATTRRLGQLLKVGDQLVCETPHGQKETLQNLILNNGGSVFIKPNDGALGKGCAIIQLKQEKLFINGQNTCIAALHDFITEPMLIEEHVQSINELASFHPSSLNTLRLITMRKPEGEIYLDRAVIRMGVGGSKVDNWSAGGVCVKVNHDGTLDKYGHFKDISLPPCTAHPDTNITFEGFTIPQFDKAVQLVLKAHAKVKRINGMGWDIAITPRGPVVIEMNPFFMLFQTPCGPLRKLIYERYLEQARKSLKIMLDSKN